MLIELIGAWLSGPTDPSYPIVTAKHVNVPRGNAVTVRVVLVNEQRMPVRTPSVTMTLNIGLPGHRPKSFSFAPNPIIGSNVFDAVLASTDTGHLRGTLTYDVWATIGAATQQVVATSYWNSGVRVG